MKEDKKNNSEKVKAVIFTDLNFSKFGTFFFTHFGIFIGFRIGHIISNWIGVVVLVLRFGTLCVVFIITLFL